LRHRLDPRRSCRSPGAEASAHELGHQLLELLLLTRRLDLDLDDPRTGS
jgi:hypothetical protein